MKKQLETLIELQKMETAAGRIQARQKNLPVQIGKLEEEFKACCDALDQERQQLEELRTRRKEKDAQLLAGQQGLKRTRERLFEVKTNKEYQSILKEIEVFEAKNSRMEDEVIAVLDELDRHETAMKVREKDLEAGRRRYEGEKAKIEADLASLAGEIEGYVRRGAELRKEIPPDLLRKYEQIKGIRRGIAVVGVWKEICDGCHMSIPPQMYNELQKERTLITCPNCNRILYWDNRNSADAH